MKVNMLEAKTQLSKLVEAAMRGEDVVIANRGKPMVRLVKAEPAKAKRRWGAWEGLLSAASIDGAFTPEADAELAALFVANARQREMRVAEPKPAYKAPKAKRRAKPVRT